MATNKQSSLPLCEKVPAKNTLHRAFYLIILFLLISLLVYRVSSLRSHGGIPWLLALLCESFFTLAWIWSTSTKWKPIDCVTYPDRLLQSVNDLPSVDMFVTTADAELEPPVITVNTVLSLLAVDYPGNKLACYVSDDGCSPVTFFALLQASKFANLWVPFCKKYHIQVRAPFRYFSNQSYASQKGSPEFLKDWQQMKDDYELLSRKIEDAARKGVDLTGEFAPFSKTERKNHPTIIKVIWENEEGSVDGVPHLVYISREKRPKHPHNYKAGAMNVLTRVSGLMTNAPFMLNMDCDFYTNNPQVVLHAMCLLLGSRGEKDSGFVQFPQKFYDAIKDDPLGNQLVVLQRYLSRGATAVQGPFYGGTGCFHRRKIIYGSSPDGSLLNEDLALEKLEKRFGDSKKLCESAAWCLLGSRSKSNNPSSISSSMEAACTVAGCAYEHGTSWGSEVGWVYGSVTEDIQTGLSIHSRGWRSVLLDLDPPAFLGSAPSNAPASLTQQKRWAVGLLEVLLSKRSPLITMLTQKLQLRACFFYMWLLSWGYRCVPELCYTVLPAYCIITNTRFLPKVEEPAALIPLALFILYNICTLREFIEAGQSVKAWWNNQKIGRIYPTCGWLFAFLTVMLKLLGITETVFEVTRKDSSSGDKNTDEGEVTDAGSFTFNESAIFIPGTTIVLLQLASLSIGFIRLLWKQERAVDGQGLGEVLCSVLILLHYSPFLKGLFGKEKYGIPSATVYKSLALTLLFVSALVQSS